MAGGLFTGVYVGMVIACADPTVPPGWLVCDGSLQPVGTYPELFNAVGHAYNGGIDPGGSQFRLPNMSGNYARGATVTAIPGSYDGSASHSHSFTPTLSASTVTGGEHNHSPGGGFSITGGGDHSHTANFSAISAATGVNSAKQTAPTAGTSAHHTHPTPGGAATNNSGNHSHSSVNGGNIVSGAGLHNHTPTVANTSITTVNYSNDPKYNLVQYLIKT